MKAGIAALALAYVLSQFFRSFLAVLAPVLTSELGATPADLGQASSLFFLTFAAAQIPVGWSLDRFGPRRTASLPLALFGVGGTVILSAATAPVHIGIGMGLIGIGVSPILMAAYFIFLRSFSPAVFATLAGLFLGFGSMGNLVGALPLALAVEAIGWRDSLRVIAVLALVAAIGILAFARDPERLTVGPKGGSFRALLAHRSLWPIFAMTLVCYAPSISLRGLWIGPYLRDTFGLDTTAIGWASLGMGLSSIAALVTFGPLDRWLGRSKALASTFGAVTILAVLGLAAGPGLGLSIALFVAIGFFGSLYPIVIAHGTRFIPAEMTGRGSSLLNLFNIGGVALLQWLTAQAYGAGPAYLPVFLTVAGFLALGLVVYFMAAKEKAQ